MAICLRPVIAKNVFACGGTNIKLICTNRERRQKTILAESFHKKGILPINPFSCLQSVTGFYQSGKKQKNYIFTKYLGIKKWLNFPGKQKISIPFGKNQINI